MVYICHIFDSYHAFFIITFSLRSNGSSAYPQPSAYSPALCYSSSSGLYFLKSVRIFFIPLMTQK